MTTTEQNNRSKQFASIVINGRFQCPYGNITIPHQSDASNLNTIGRIRMNVGGANNQGQIIRSWYELNNNGPLFYIPQTLDNTNILNTYASIFNLYPNLTNYPYLYSTERYEEKFITALETQLQFPIYKYLGRGLGKIEYYNAANRKLIGLPELGQSAYMPFYYSDKFIDKIYVTRPRVNGQSIWPYSGLLYSGSCVQFEFENQEDQENQETNNLQQVKILPYTTGRGIQQYDATKEYFAGDAFGYPSWKSGESNDPLFLISSQLSSGVSPGNNNYCVGIVLDTSLININNKFQRENQVTRLNYSTLYQYKIPEYYTKEDFDNAIFSWQPYYYHPSSFTVPPANTQFKFFPSNQSNHQRIFSPQNYNLNYYAPWPRYYAYQPNDQVPVLHDGLTSCMIGAATNIGMQAYYLPQLSIDDNTPINNPNYLSVSCVPLFQGEKIIIGSYVYCSAMGHIITPNEIGESPYLPASYTEASGLDFAGINIPPPSVFYQHIQRKGRKENPWYDWCDPTFGSTGWTNTPAFQFTYLVDHDQDLSIIQTRDPSISPPKRFPYLNQSNQGSIYVTGVTITNPFNDGGSGRRELLTGAKYHKINSTTSKKFDRISRFPATIERSLCIGNIVEEIEGTGQWPYTGTILNFEQINQVICGYGYSLGSYDTFGGSGTGAIVEVTSIDLNGSITGVTLISPGNGYTNNDILTLYTPVINETFGEGTINVNANNGCVRLNTTVSPNTISLHYGGSNYTSDVNIEGFNLSANNLIIEATAEDYPFSPYGLYTRLSSTFGITSIDSNRLDRYPIGTLLEVYTSNAAKGDLAIIQIVTNDGLTVTVGRPTQYYYPTYEKGGSANLYLRGTYNYSTRQHTRQSNLKLKIQADSLTGEITSIEILDMGFNNRNGDLILIRQPGSDNNCCFVLDNQIGLIQNFVQLNHRGGAFYYYDDFFAANTTQTSTPLPPYILGNEVNVLNPGLINSNQTGTIVAKLTNGVISNFAFTPVINSLYTGLFGNIQTIEQQYKYNLPFQPDPSGGPALAQPATGWPTFVNRRTATFYQNVRIFIRIAGSGYTVGGPYTCSGGSGTDFEVFILKIGNNGAVEEIQVANIGTNYALQDDLIINSGNNDCSIILKVPTTQEVDFRFMSLPLVPTTYIQGPVMFWNLKILNGGTGYVVGGPFSTTCPIYDTTGAINLIVNILSVDSITGAILDIEVAQYDNINLTGYQLGYRIQVDGGNNDSLIELSSPIPAEEIQFTSGGTNYTTGNNISTFNLSANNLIVLCGLETSGPGECEVSNYGITDEAPSGWDLSRYQIGDLLAFNQDGNISSTAEILTIDEATSSITFNQVTLGTNYIQPVTSNYGLLPTRNLSSIETTVDIITNPITGEIIQTTINTLGNNVRYGDYLVIEQPGSDFNAIYQVLGERDCPAPWQRFINGREATRDEWNQYNLVLQSAVNLLEFPCLIDFKKMYPNYYNNSYYFYGDPDNKDPINGNVQIRV